MSRKPHLNVNKDEFVEMFENHYKYTTIAVHFGISLHSIHKLRIKFGLPRRCKPLVLNIKEFKRLYCEGIKIKEIAKELKISRVSVYRIRDSLGLPRRYGRRRVDHA